MPTRFRRLAGVAAVAISLALGGLLLAGSAAAAVPAHAASDGHALPPPTAGTQAKLRAYGKSCAKVGRRSDARVKRSAFAACLDAMARLGSGRTQSPRKACRAVSRKRLKGTSGSPYSRCVVAGAKLLRDKRRAAAGDPGATPAEDDAGAGEQPEDPAADGSDGELEDPGGDPGPDDDPGDVDLDSLPGPVIE